MNARVLIWDIPVRLFHWLLVMFIAYSWYAIEIMEDLEQHFLSGYCILALVSFRIVWGFVGTRHARFSDFIYPLSETLSYIRALPGKTGKRYSGHNPAGGLSVMAMLLFLLVQVSTGLFSTDDYYHGPLNALVSDATAATITEIHHLSFDILTGLIALHILAIVYYRVFGKEKLLAAMFTGKKVVQDKNLKPVAGSKLLLAAFIIGVCAAGVYLLSNRPFESETSAAEYNFY